MRARIAKLLKEAVPPFGVPRAFRPPGYWWPAIVRDSDGTEGEDANAASGPKPCQARTGGIAQ